MLRRRWDILLLRIRSLLAREAVEEDLAKELRFHLDAEMEEAGERGLSTEDARLHALKRLGGVAQIEEECRDTRRTAMLEATWQDAKYGIRALLRTPGFTSILVFTLALSIGATTAIVSVV